MARATTFDYKVTVVDSGGNKYAIDGNTQQYVILFPGGTYKFDQSDSTNGGHPLRFSETDNGTHASGSEYTTGVTTAGTPGSSGAYTQIEVTSDTPHTLYYYCTQHSGMGGEVNTPENFSISNTNDRIILGGGYSDPTNFLNTIQMFQARSKGNAADFGDLSVARQSMAVGCVSSSTRGLFYGGDDSGPATYTDIIDFITMASAGNATDFGNENVDDSGGAGFSNDTRAGKMGGFTGGGPDFAGNDIEYVTIATTGNATNFGDLQTDRYGNAGCGSTTRAISGGAASYPGTTVYSDIMDYITIASTGNGTDFGNMSEALDNCSAASSNTRGIWMGGNNGSIKLNTIQYVTIASTSNTTDFGDLAVATRTSMGASNNISCFKMGGNTPSYIATIEEFVIASTGNAADFGDLTAIFQDSGSVSPNHGGIA